MARRRHTPDQILAKLRDADVMLADGRPLADIADYLIEENRVLREQLGGKVPRLSDDQRCRLAANGKRLGRRLLIQVATIVAADTILRWHHRLIAAKWTYKAKRVGRPGLKKHIRELIVRFARENSGWGYAGSRVR